MVEQALDYQFMVHEEYPLYVAVQTPVLYDTLLHDLSKTRTYLYYPKQLVHRTVTARLRDFHYSFFNEADWPLTLFLVTSCYVHPAPLPLVLQQRAELDAVLNALKKLKAPARQEVLDAVLR